MESWKIKSSLKMDVYTNLKEAILSGELEDNMSITQRSAQELYGVSGTPFREAIQILESEGLVYSLPNKGVYVSPLTFNDVEEIFQIRKIFETSVAEMVAKDFDEGKYDELSYLIRLMNTDTEEQTKKEFTNLDHQFHKKLIEYTNNSRLMAMNEQIYDMMRRIGNVLLKDAKRRETVIKEHREILAGLETGNVREPILNHLNSVREKIKKYYD
ncbi:GntR family transcriptional regulator [Pseudogracilibacillus auburnensis]|uniref:GntR family transcriptional regulator n=1 Tax=Pseudogracilibacillus auburnensis TaxID=1494959 RepID=A0A2V3VQQ1_9BACI|nr:GntR family transcriptional regulator [Pseudogracilibacillus auburnensis]PXW82335.1 GntR family transcriptional regulator [Pseudogracilibacillus auburnensis]